MRLTLTARLRHGILWEAARRAGSNVALAKLLGISNGTLGEIINLKMIPSREWVDRRWAEWERVLLVLLNRLIDKDELFPEVYRERGPLGDEAVMEATQDVATLPSRRVPPLLTESVEDSAIRAERDDLIQNLLLQMDPRHAKIIRSRFGFDGDPMTLEQVGDEMHICKESVRRIEEKFFAKVRRCWRVSQPMTAFAKLVHDIREDS